MGNKSTSVAALLRPSAARTRRREAILASIKEEPATRYEVAKRLGVAVNCVTCAVRELVLEGLLVEHSQVMQETGHKGWQLHAAGGSECSA